mmetsp:Transcript_63775/g.152066  ORF Transcript_63775/g.152066 Transcript_63775/m.152066 type:complete len:163 (+) Transcript_63775:61-549(+)
MDEGPISTLLASSGVTIPSRARFVGKFYAWTGLASMSLGLLAGQLGASLGFGPILPFMSGSWLGFTLSCITFWKNERRRAEEYLLNYPQLMEHVLRTEYGTFAGMHNGISLAAWLRGPRLPVWSWTLLASQSCAPHVQAIEDERRDRIVEKYKQLEVEYVTD